VLTRVPVHITHLLESSTFQSGFDVNKRTKDLPRNRIDLEIQIFAIWSPPWAGWVLWRWWEDRSCVCDMTHSCLVCDMTHSYLSHGSFIVCQCVALRARMKCENALLCAAAWCSVLQHVAICCSVWHCARGWHLRVLCSVLQCAALRARMKPENALQFGSVRCGGCNVLQCVAAVLQCVALRARMISHTTHHIQHSSHRFVYPGMNCMYVLSLSLSHTHTHTHYSTPIRIVSSQRVFIYVCARAYILCIDILRVFELMFESWFFFFERD